MTDRLDCKDRERRNGITIGLESDLKLPVARTRARKLAIERAEQNVFGFFAARFTCPAGCPALKLTVRLERPVDELALPGPYVGAGGVIQWGWTCTALCAWSVLIRCTNAPALGGNIDAQPQELECDDEDEVAVLSGTAKGEGVDSDKDNAAQKAAADAIAKLEVALSHAVDLVSCNPECPHKKVTAYIGATTTACPAAPDENDRFTCTAAIEWAVHVRCY